MHVLLDARVIRFAKTGDRTYWLGLLEALPRVAPDCRFTCLLDGPPDPGLVPSYDNLDVVVEPTPTGRLWTQIALPRVAKRLGVDLVHLQYTAPLNLPCRFVTTIHDCSFELFPETFTLRDRLWLRRFVPWSARRAGAVVGVSETTRQDLLRLYRLPPDRVFAAPNGISKLFQPASPSAAAAIRERYGLPETYLLSVGVLQPRKNLVGLLEAYAAAVREHGVAAPLVVVGKKGWLYQSLFERVASLGLADRVKFTGYVPDEDLPGLYTGATLSLYPSLYEGFGLPPLESMACGTPCLVSTTAALVEVTGPGWPQFPPDDAAGWAQAMADLLADPAELARLSTEGQARAAAYTWERSAAVHLAAYQRAIDG